jgi:hypothetical protein
MVFNVFVTVSLFVSSERFSSNTVLTTAFFSAAKTSFFIVGSLKSDWKIESIRLKCLHSKQFSLFLLFTLLAWNCFINAGFRGNRTEFNRLGLIFTGCCFCVITIVGKRLDIKEFNHQSSGLSFLSSFFCIFCGISSGFVENNRVLDDFFSFVLILVIFSSSFFTFIKTFPKFSNIPRKIDETLEDLSKDVIKI